MTMEKFWEKALAVTGPVAVISCLVALFINRGFEHEVLEHFGSDKSFYLVVGVLCIGLRKCHYMKLTITNLHRSH